jgi:hypothetical protein
VARDDASFIHHIRSKELADKCLAVPTNMLAYSKTDSTVDFDDWISITGDVNRGYPISLKNCDASAGPEWTILSFRGPALAPKEMAATMRDEVPLTDLQPSQVSSETVVDSNAYCEFLSIPVSTAYWPTEDLKDKHERCITVRAQNEMSTSTYVK